MRLAKAIGAIRREIATALDEKTPLPAGARLHADRVVLSLRVAMTDEEQLQVLTSERPGAEAHTITIEFAVDRGAVGGRSPKDQAVQELRIESATAEGIVNALMQVFGVPSFDSSARATVFRETVGALPEDQARVLIDSLGNAPSAEMPVDLKTAARIVKRLFEKGPTGVKHSAQVLQEISRLHALAPLLTVIEANWKTPDAWA